MSDDPTTPGIDQGSWEVLRDRLRARSTELAARAERLNARRLEVFGGAEMSVAGNVRVRTENNCVPRDIAQVGSLLLFGYNVFLGLRSETRVHDVFSVHRFEENDDGSVDMQSAVHRRLASLDKEVQETLRLVSVLGLEFELRVAA